ncbi:hypothetical protein [uncultured Algibacter sp.]|uniref:hypothetical protein n=1 Tax=uncultured Algibacter sp. TaxID=298659 RepID=UPI002619F745|nr:hypothetical protein [uncultured Algibacter sp.]
MDLFNYISIAFSFVYTAAALRLLGGISSATNKQSRYLVHLLFIVIQLISIITSFWGAWALRDLEGWKLYKFLIVLMDGALYYFIATVLVPENPNEIKSWKDYYYKNKHKLYYAILTFLVYIQLNAYVLTDQKLFHPAQFFHLIGLFPIYFGLKSKNHKVHVVISLYYLILVLTMMFTVASKPGWIDQL